MTQLQGIIFDKDGTLFEFAATWEAWAQAFLLRMTDNDRDKARELGVLIGFDMDSRSFARDSVVIAGTPGEVADALAPCFPGQSQAQVLDILNEEASMAPQVEAVSLIPFFASLHAMGLKVGVATNDAEEPALAHLGKAGVMGSLDFVAGFDSGHGAKPGPGQLLAFCAQTGCDPDRVAMVGDSTHDLRAGQAAGMLCIAVLTGMASADDLEPHADVVLPDVGHIPAWLTANT
jgi:phosphoglycolate phosphatase